MISVELYVIGIFVEVRGKDYEVMANIVNSDEEGIRHLLDLQPIDDESNRLDEKVIRIDTDMHDIRIL